MMRRLSTWTLFALMLGALAVMSGCRKEDGAAPEGGGAMLDDGTRDCAPVEGDGTWCDYTGGNPDGPVKVSAFYPGGHETTLAAVKELLEEFPDKVSVEIVDWRREEGLEKRIEAGLAQCAGIVINGRHVIEIQEGDATREVSFTRCIDVDWSRDDLMAAVRQEVEAAAQ